MKAMAADEPTGSLDATSSHQVMTLLHQVSRVLSMTVLLVTHGLNMTNDATRTVRIGDGKVLAVEAVSAASLQADLAADAGTCHCKQRVSAGCRVEHGPYVALARTLTTGLSQKSSTMTFGTAPFLLGSSDIVRVVFRLSAGDAGRPDPAAAGLVP